MVSKGARQIEAVVDSAVDHHSAGSLDALSLRSISWFVVSGERRNLAAAFCAEDRPRVANVGHHQLLVGPVQQCHYRCTAHVKSYQWRWWASGVGGCIVVVASMLLLLLPTAESVIGGDTTAQLIPNTVQLLVALFTQQTTVKLEERLLECSY